MRIHHLMEQFTPSERRVAEFLLESGADVLSMPIVELAKRCRTSTTTVIRLCKALDYKGYKELCIALSTDLATGGGERLRYEDIHPGDDLETIVRHVAAHNSGTIADTVSVLDMENLAQAVDALARAERVDFYGVGSSGLVALDAQQKWLRLGKNTQAAFDVHVQAVLAATLKPADAAVFFSYSGETQDTLDTLIEAQKAGAATISVTRYGANTISRGADIPLYVASSEALVRSGAMASRIAMLHIVDILYTATATKAYYDYKPYLDKTHYAGRNKRSRQRNRRKDVIRKR